MKISYNVTGAERKALVGAIAKELGTAAKYLGMPTAAYQVGDYHIDKNGTVTGPDDRGLTADLCGLHDFKAVNEDYDDSPDIDQHHPGRYADPNEPPTDEMLKHAEAWMQGQPEYEDLKLSEREELGLGREHREDWQGESGMHPSDLPEPELNEGAHHALPEETRAPGLTVEVPLEGFTPEKLDNLTKLVAAKAELLKAALGVESLPIQQTAGTLRFPWFNEGIDSEHAQAYATLVSLLCKAAKEKTRVTAKARAIDGSLKFAMRSFLLSLGFIGAEYKAARKILLSRLEGSAAWKRGKGAQEAHKETKP